MSAQEDRPRHPLLKVVSDLMNDRGKRMLVRSLPFAFIIAILITLQPQYAGLEKIGAFFMVAILAVALLLVVLLVPRTVIVLMRAKDERQRLDEFIKTAAYEEIRQEWRET